MLSVFIQVLVYIFYLLKPLDVDLGWIVDPIQEYQTNTKSLTKLFMQRRKWSIE